MKSIELRLTDEAYRALVRYAAREGVSVGIGARMALHRALGVPGGGEMARGRESRLEREMGGRAAARLDGEMREVLGDG